MPNDAKLGLIAGVAVVVMIAALFFRREDAPVQVAPVQAATEPGAMSAPMVAEPKSFLPPAQPEAELPPLPPPPLLSEP
jgi:hypothetical protein